MWIQLLCINPRLCLPNIASNSPTRQFNWSASVNVPSDLLFLFQATAISICIIKRGLLIAFCCYVFLFCFLSLIPFSPLICFSILILQASKWSFRFRLSLLNQNKHKNSLHRRALREKLPAIFHQSTRHLLVLTGDIFKQKFKSESLLQLQISGWLMKRNKHHSFDSSRTQRENPPALQIFSPAKKLTNGLYI